MRLGWHAVWNFPETIRQTVEWYRGYHRGGDPKALISKQIVEYQTAAANLRLPWVT
jgi:hypothetical protein